MYVIGDNFNSIIDGKNFFSFDDCINLSNDFIGNNIKLGQGLREKEIEELQVAGVIPEIKFSNSKLVHKSSRKNVQLYNIEKINSNFYKAFSYAFNDNEILNDHITGHHIPGILIIESARQLTIAYIESEYDNSPNSFILNKIESNFDGYIFPLDIHLEMEVNIQCKNKYTEIIAKINVIQSSVSKCNIIISGMFMDKSLFEITEKMAMNQLRKELTNG